MRLHLQLITQTQNSSLSILTVAGDWVCFVLEDGYRQQKVMHETRIPPGVYQIAKRTFGKFFSLYKRKYGHEFVPELLDVPMFSDILMHIGNFITDTSGCLLVGLGAKNNGKDFSVLESEGAYLELYELLKIAFDRGEKVEIEISRELWQKPAIAL